MQRQLDLQQVTQAAALTRGCIQTWPCSTQTVSGLQMRSELYNVPAHHASAQTWRSCQVVPHATLQGQHVSASKKVAILRQCFNGITVGTDERFCCFPAGLNPVVHYHAVTAPFELGTHGKWMGDCDLRMDML